MRNTLKIIPFLIAFLLVLFTLSSAAQHKVIRIVDGDTIVVNYKGKYEKVRLLCVNTPESVHPDKKQNTFMGKVASDYTKESLEGKYADLEFEEPRRGKYGRLLAYVFVEGKNFNLELVEMGLSPYYTKYGLSQNYDKEFREAERYAQKHKLNIWENYELTQKYLRLKSKWGQHRSQKSSPTPANKTNESKGISNVQITNIFYDGLVKRTESDEYVEITNLGSKSQDLSGWILMDISDGSPSFTFPAYILKPKQSIRVYTNEIHPEWGGFSFGYGRAIWNNKDPDVAGLFNHKGKEVFRRSY